MVSFVCWYRKILPISLGRNNYGLAEQQAVLLLLKDVPVWVRIVAQHQWISARLLSAVQRCRCKNNAAS